MFPSKAASVNHISFQISKLLFLSLDTHEHILNVCFFFCTQVYWSQWDYLIKWRLYVYNKHKETVKVLFYIQPTFSTLLLNHSAPKSLSPFFKCTHWLKKLRSIKLNQLKFSHCKIVIITQQHVTFPLSPLRISRAWEVRSHTAVTRHSVSRVLWKPFCLPLSLSCCQTISAAAPLCFVPPAKASYMARLEVSVFTARHTLLCDIKPRGL